MRAEIFIGRFLSALRAPLRLNGFSRRGFAFNRNPTSQAALFSARDTRQPSGFKISCKVAGVSARFLNHPVAADAPAGCKGRRQRSEG